MTWEVIERFAPFKTREAPADVPPLPAGAYFLVEQAFERSDAILVTYYKSRFCEGATVRSFATAQTLEETIEHGKREAYNSSS